MALPPARTALLLLFITAELYLGDGRGQWEDLHVDASWCLHYTHSFEELRGTQPSVEPEWAELHPDR
eukprot:1159344-Pelagomonas_calceolata.AAC.20